MSADPKSCCGRGKQPCGCCCGAEEKTCACVSVSAGVAEREARQRPTVEAPLIVWEYVFALERQLEAAEKALREERVRRYTEALEVALSLAEGDELYAEIFRPYFKRLLEAGSAARTESELMVICSWCHKNHAARPGDNECGEPGTWTVASTGLPWAARTESEPVKYPNNVTELHD